MGVLLTIAGGLVMGGLALLDLHLGNPGVPLALVRLLLAGGVAASVAMAVLS